MIKNIFVNVKRAFFAKYSIVSYAIQLRRKTDDGIRACVEHERGLRAWCSQRSYFLAALQYECKRRGIDYIQ